MQIKHEITRSLLLKLDDAPALHAALRHWWHDPRPGSGLRLSTQGLSVMRKLEVEHYFFEIVPLKPAQLLILNRALTCPYYLQPLRGKSSWQLILFGGREATMYALYGDVIKFAQALDRR